MIGNILFALVFLGSAFLLGGWPTVLMTTIIFGALFFLEQQSG